MGVSYTTTTTTTTTTVLQGGKQWTGFYLWRIPVGVVDTGIVTLIQALQTNNRTQDNSYTTKYRLTCHSTTCLRVWLGKSMPTTCTTRERERERERESSWRPCVVKQKAVIIQSVLDIAEVTLFSSAYRHLPFTYCYSSKWDIARHSERHEDLLIGIRMKNGLQGEKLINSPPPPHSLAWSSGLPIAVCVCVCVCVCE